MAQDTPYKHTLDQEKRLVAIAIGFGLPSWLISIIAHVALLALMATLTWSVTRDSPPRNLTVGIMVKRNPAHVDSFESKDTTFVAREDPANQSTRFLADVEPRAVSDSLPQLPEVDLSGIGLSGSLLSSPGDMLATPDTGISTGAMVNTQFFGAQVWGSKFVYVIDRSGSMTHRDRFGAAKRELLASLSHLPPETQFQIIFYNLRADPLLQPKAPKLHNATDQNKVLASREMQKIVPDGGTEHLPALKAALSLKPDVIFFLTDADDLRELDVNETTSMNKDQAKIHTIEFGIGAVVDQENQLRVLANRNGGSYRYVDAAKLDQRVEEGVR